MIHLCKTRLYNQVCINKTCIRKVWGMAKIIIIDRLLNQHTIVLFWMVFGFVPLVDITDNLSPYSSRYFPIYLYNFLLSYSNLFTSPVLLLITLSLNSWRKTWKICHTERNIPLQDFNISIKKKSEISGQKVLVFPEENIQGFPNIQGCPSFLCDVLQ